VGDDGTAAERTAYRDKLRSVGYLSRGRSDRRRVTAQGRHHPESGQPFQTVTDECGNDVTEHGRPGTGVSSRQDVLIRPEPVRANLEEFL